MSVLYHSFWTGRGICPVWVLAASVVSRTANPRHSPHIIVHCLLKHTETLVISGSRINKYSLCYNGLPRGLYQQIQFVCASCVVFLTSAVTLLPAV